MKIAGQKRRKTHKNYNADYIYRQDKVSEHVFVLLTLGYTFCLLIQGILDLIDSNNLDRKERLFSLDVSTEVGRVKERLECGDRQTWVEAGGERVFGRKEYREQNSDKKRRWQELEAAENTGAMKCSGRRVERGRHQVG